MRTLGACDEYTKLNLSVVLLNVELGIRFSYSAVVSVFERPRGFPLTDKASEDMAV